MGKSLATAATVIEALRQTEWDLFRGLTRLDDDRRGAATGDPGAGPSRPLFRRAGGGPGGRRAPCGQQSREAAKLLANVPAAGLTDDRDPSIRRRGSGSEVTTIDQGEGQGWDAAGWPGDGGTAPQLEADPALRVSLSWTLSREERP